MRYVFLLGLALRKSLTLAMQYRWDFVFSGALSLLWTASGLVPFYIAFLFTFVIPIGIMTTYPAEALLGTLTPHLFVGTLVGALLFSSVARIVWIRALGHYTSASS